MTGTVPPPGGAPPGTLTEFAFTNYLGRAVVVRFALDAHRTYNAPVPRGAGVEGMVAARYLDAAGAYPDPLCAVWAARSVGVPEILDALVRASVRYQFTARERPGGGMMFIGGGGPPPVAKFVGISWPLSTTGLARMAAHDYTGYRLRGGAGFVRPILAEDYAGAAFWVEPNGVPSSIIIGEG